MVPQGKIVELSSPENILAKECSQVVKLNDLIFHYVENIFGYGKANGEA
jgi:hypothetical protein